MLCVEIAISSADFASDVLNTFGNDYYGFSTFSMMVSITFAAGVCTILGQYSGMFCRLLFSTYQWLAWPTWMALKEKGMHQVFEEHGDSVEKFGCNVAVMLFFGILTPVLILVVAPIGATLYVAMMFFLGVVLHSLRLLFAKEVLVMYESCIGKATESSKSQRLGRAELIAEEPSPHHETVQHVDRRKYHLMVFVELLVEAGPSIGATVLNYFLMRGSYLTRAWQGFIRRQVHLCSLSFFLSFFLSFHVMWMWYLNALINR